MNKKIKGQFTGVILVSLFSFTDAGLSRENSIYQLSYDVEVVLKLIPVRVINKKGNYIGDLQKNEFSLFLDNKRIEITDFEKHVPSSNRVSVISGEPETRSANTNKKRLNRKILLFFDFAFNSVRGIRRSRDIALKFLEEKIEYGDEIAIISYTATQGLHIGEFFSSDIVRLREQVKNFSIKDLSGRAENVEQAYLEFTRAQEEGGTYMPRGDSPEGTLLNFQRSRVESQSQIRHYIGQIKELARALRYVPGTKNWLFFSSGPPSSLIYPKTRSDPLSPMLRDEYEDLLKELADSNNILFSFDAHEYGGPEAAASGAYTIERMAKQTGGRYYGDITSLKNLDDIQNLTESYYVLGFPYKDKIGTDFHKIKVSVSRPGCRVSTLAGFFDTKPFSKLSPFERALHLADVALSKKPLFQTPLLTIPLRAYFSPFPKDTNIILLADLPVSALRNDGFNAVEIIDIILDISQKVVSMKRRKADLAKIEEPRAVYWSAQRLEPALYECRTVVRDLETGRAAVGSANAEITDNRNLCRFFPPVFFAFLNQSISTSGALSLFTNSKAISENSYRVIPDFIFPNLVGWTPVFDLMPMGYGKFMMVCPYRNNGKSALVFRTFLAENDVAGRPLNRYEVDFEHLRSDSGGVIILELPLEIVLKRKQITIWFEDWKTGFSFSSRVAFEK